MFALLANPKNEVYIKKAINNLDGEIVYENIEEVENLEYELNIISRIGIKHLIIDSTCCENEKHTLVKILMQYRILNEQVQIIWITDDAPGDEILSDLVKKVQIRDIISTENLTENLENSITNPSNYKNIVKWINAEESIPSRKKSEIVIKKQLVGKVVIGLGGTHHRVGTTHLSLLLAHYLNNKNHSVAVIQLNDSSDIKEFLNSYDGLEVENEYYSLNNIHYYLYNHNFNINIPYSRNYDFFILDIGVYDEKNPFKNEFDRSHVKAILSTAREWEIKYLEKFFIDNEINNYQFHYLFNFTDNESYSFICKNINIEHFYKTYKIELDSNIVEGKKNNHVFDTWLKQFVGEPKGTKINFKKLFGRRKI